MINPADFTNIGASDGGIRTLKNDSAIGAGDGTVLDVTSLQDAFVTQQKAIIKLRSLYDFYAGVGNGLQSYNGLHDNSANGYQMLDFHQKFYGATPWFTSSHQPSTPGVSLVDFKARFTGGFTGLEFSGLIAWGDGGVSGNDNLFVINATGAGGEGGQPQIKDFINKRWAVPQTRDDYSVVMRLLKVVVSGPNFSFRLDTDIPPGLSTANFIYLDGLRVATEFDFYTQP